MVVAVYVPEVRKKKSKVKCSTGADFVYNDHRTDGKRIVCLHYVNYSKSDD